MDNERNVGRSGRALEPREPVLIQVESETRGFSHPRNFLRWCRRNGVETVRDGKRTWVVPLEVSRAVERIRGASLKAGRGVAAPAVDVGDDLTFLLGPKRR